MRRERPHPGAQLDLIEERDGWRYTCFATDTPTGQHACLDARHRTHARVEDRIRTGKDAGLGRLPSKLFAINAAWLACTLTAIDLLAWAQTILLHDEPVLARAEPKTLRYRLLHVAVPAAVRDEVTVDEAALSIGHVREDGGVVTREIRYSNPTERPVHLQLSADVHGTGIDAKIRPDLEFDRSKLTVPAHGTATATITLDPADTDDGRYAGELVADVSGHPSQQVHSGRTRPA